MIGNGQEQRAGGMTGEDPPKVSEVPWNQSEMRRQGAVLSTTVGNFPHAPPTHTGKRTYFPVCVFTYIHEAHSVCESGCQGAHVHPNS